MAAGKWRPFCLSLNVLMFPTFLQLHITCKKQFKWNPLNYNHKKCNSQDGKKTVFKDQNCKNMEYQARILNCYMFHDNWIFFQFSLYYLP